MANKKSVYLSRLEIRLSKDLLEKLTVYTEKHEISNSSLVRSLIVEKLEKEKINK